MCVRAFAQRHGRLAGKASLDRHFCKFLNVTVSADLLLGPASLASSRARKRHTSSDTRAEQPWLLQVCFSHSRQTFDLHFETLCFLKRGHDCCTLPSVFAHTLPDSSICSCVSGNSLIFPPHFGIIYIFSDPVLSELLAHFGLSDFEAALNADKFGVENLLQVCVRAVLYFASLHCFSFVSCLDTWR